jgi:microcystin-dependent protein
MQISLAFPDQTYSEANKPAAGTIKSDLAAIEEAFNDLESEAIRSDGSVAMAADLAMGGNQITGLGAPVAATDAAPIGSVYPVGSVYINAEVATNPATLLGFGTWAAIAAGRMLIGQNGADADFDTAGETGGAKTAALATTNLPSHTHTGTTASDGAHTHSVTDPGHTHSMGITHGDQDGSSSNGAIDGSLNTGSATTGISIVSGGAHTHTFTTAATGDGTAFSIMNPFLVVYMWKRTA